MKVLWFLLEKEFKQFLRNKFLPRLVLVLPFLAIAVFPLVANMDVKNLSLALVDSDHSATSRKLVEKVSASPHFTVVGYFGSGVEALRCVEVGDADIVLEIPPLFEQTLYREKRAKVMISANAVNGMQGGLGSAYLNAIIMDNNAQPSLSIRPLFLYNPGLDYSRFMIPALMAMILAILCGFLPALNIVGEKEKGTIEQLNVTPVGKLQFVISKLVPYWVAGIVTFALSMFSAYLFYGMTPAGSIGLICLFSVFLILSFSGFGLIVSNYASTIQQAIFIMLFFVITMVFVSGLYTPFQNMPVWTQVLGSVSPLKYYIEALRMLYLKGSGLSEMLIPQLFPLVGLALFFNLWAVLGYRKQS